MQLYRESENDVQKGMGPGLPLIDAAGNLPAKLAAVIFFLIDCHLTLASCVL
jgi:hypothetical protein